MGVFESVPRLPVRSVQAGDLVNDDICVVIPSIPIRPKLLNRAVRSVLQQSYPTAGISVAVDIHHEGAWVTRNRALDGSTGDWIAFLDDDDEFMPHHLGFLIDLVKNTKSDLAWGWFEVVGGTDPFPQHRGKEYAPYPSEMHHCIPISYMVRRDLAMEAKAKMGGFEADEPGIGAWEHQDMRFIDCMWDLSGGNFVTSPRASWRWHHYTNPDGSPGNTSGLPSRW